MKPWPFLVSTFAFVATPAVAESKISPDELFQKAKQKCPELATTDKGWRACIERAKTEIILSYDVQARAICSKYQGAERASCAHFTYLGGRDWTPSRREHDELRWKHNQETLENAARKPGYVPFSGVGVPGWFLPEERRVPEDRINRQGKNYEAIEREMRERAKRNDPRSRQSTITGPTTTNKIKGGGTESQKISRPDFLKKSQGIDLPTRTEGREGHIGVDPSDIERLVDK